MPCTARRLHLPVIAIAVLVGSVLTVSAAATALAAGAARSRTVRCIGNGDFCGATVSIAGGASNRVVTIALTDTDFTRVGIRVIPRASRGSFSISRARFLLGGSEYRFTLSAVRGNPRSARIILLFASSASVAG
ncbi:MAG TPA: hypothetical protein VFN87_22355 [Solirubrobacteraceae bacterium]|nr:hypothetical protein [Solirubrobacteraceae bacterium]